MLDLSVDVDPVPLTTRLGILASILRPLKSSIGLLVFAGGGCVALAAVGAAAGAGTGFTGILPFGIVEVPTAIGAEDEGFCCRWSLYVTGIGARDVVTIGTVSFDEEAAT